MSIRDLVPWGWSKKNVPVRRETHDDPFHLLQRRMNGLFDDFWSDFNLSPLSGSLMREGFSPKMEIKETDQNVTVTAEAQYIRLLSLIDNSKKQTLPFFALLRFLILLGRRIGSVCIGRIPFVVLAQYLIDGFAVAAWRDGHS